MSSSVIVLLMNPLERDIFSSVLLGGSEVVLSYYGMSDMDLDVAITLRDAYRGGTDVRCGYYWQPFYAEENHRNSIWD